MKDKLSSTMFRDDNVDLV